MNINPIIVLNCLGKESRFHKKLPFDIPDKTEELIWQPCEILISMLRKYNARKFGCLTNSFDKFDEAHVK